MTLSYFDWYLQDFAKRTAASVTLPYIEPFRPCSSQELRGDQAELRRRYALEVFGNVFSEDSEGVANNDNGIS